MAAAVTDMATTGAACLSRRSTGWAPVPSVPPLVTAYLPGHRCATTLVGRATPEGQLWRLGAALVRVLATSTSAASCIVK
jgi:hypothetical protein